MKKMLSYGVDLFLFALIMFTMLFFIFSNATTETPEYVLGRVFPNTANHEGALALGVWNRRADRSNNAVPQLNSISPLSTETLRLLTEIKDKNVIDVGSGTIHFAALCLLAGAKRVMCIDNSSLFLQEARTERAAISEEMKKLGYSDESISTFLKRLPCLQADYASETARRLIKSASVDLINGGHVLKFLPPDKWPEFFQTVNQDLKKDGTCFIEDAYDAKMEKPTASLPPIYPLLVISAPGNNVQAEITDFEDPNLRGLIFTYCLTTRKWEIRDRFNLSQVDESPEKKYASTIEKLAPLIKPIKKKSTTHLFFVLITQVTGSEGLESALPTGLTMKSFGKNGKIWCATLQKSEASEDTPV